MSLTSDSWHADFHSLNRLLELRARFDEHTVAWQAVQQHKRLKPQSYVIETHQQFNENMRKEIVTAQNSGVIQPGLKFACHIWGTSHGQILNEMVMSW